MTKYNILLIGSGGREHALADAIIKSESWNDLYVSPGNAGILEIVKKADIDADNFDEIVNFCKNNDIDLVVIGPEQPLVDGLADILRENNIACFGPSKEASQIEGSKAFMKNLAKKYNIPTAKYENFENEGEAKQYIENNFSDNENIVVKTDGLAAGKGVIIAENKKDAIEAVEYMFSGGFGSAGAKIVVEEFLEGEELSFFAISDGKKIVPFGSAQDHKRALDGDKGLNTGGMGCYSPAPVATEEIEQKIMGKCVKPLIEGMANDNIPYIGVLFVGVMIKDNEPKLLEYNIRFGDPEAQTILPRFEGDFANLLFKSATGILTDEDEQIKLSDDNILTVVMAAKGYPESYNKGTKIGNIEEVNELSNVNVCHAGTKKDNSGNIVANGGRVLNIIGKAKTLMEAKNNAYKGVEMINWQDSHYRKDIGWRAL